MEKVLEVCILKVFHKRSKKIRILPSNSLTRTHDLPFPADARRPLKMLGKWTSLKQELQPIPASWVCNWKTSSPFCGLTTRILVCLQCPRSVSALNDQCVDNLIFCLPLLWSSTLVVAPVEKFPGRQTCQALVDFSVHCGWLQTGRCLSSVEETWEIIYSLYIMIWCYWFRATAVVISSYTFAVELS